MEKHLTRKELMAVAASPQDQWPDHVRKCEICRQAITLLAQFPMIGRLHLPEPPDAWVAVAKALTAPAGLPALVRNLVGRLAFDSWLLPSPAGVRGGAVATDRRLRYEIDPMIVDIRVEHRGNIWSSVAQISGTEDKTINLLINGRVIPQGAGGMVQYSGSQPPRRIAIQVNGHTVELPEVSWRKPRTS